MVHFVYRLTFDDDSKYIGITSNLNQRVNTHKKTWKKDYGLTIKHVEIVRTCESEREARVVETTIITAYGLGNLRNKVISTVNFADSEIPTTISDMLLGLDSEPEETQIRIISKKLQKLQDKYITMFYEYDRMKENIKELDSIINRAVYGELNDY